MTLKLWSRIGLVTISLVAVQSCRKTDHSTSTLSASLTREVEHPSVVPLLRDTSSPITSAGTRESEPTAGSWRTVLLGDPREIRVPPPPIGSAEKREMGELRKRAARRDEQVLRSISWWDAGSVQRWNEIARGFAARQHLNSCQGSRMFALLAAAQYDALVTTWHYKYFYRRP